MSAIFQTPGGAKLFQVGKAEIPEIIRNNYIGLIILAAEEFQPTDFFPKITKFYAPLRDSTNLYEDEIKKTLRIADAASSTAAKYLMNGYSVISSCAAGLNRSGLISAFTIEKCTGAPKKEILKQIRKHRSPIALFNGLFVSLFENNK